MSKLLFILLGIVACTSPAYAVLTLTVTPSVACAATGSVPVTGTVAILCDLDGADSVNTIVSDSGTINILRAGTVMYSVSTAGAVTAASGATATSSTAAATADTGVTLNFAANTFTDTDAAASWTCSVTGAGTTAKNEVSTAVDLGTYCLTYTLGFAFTATTSACSGGTIPDAEGITVTCTYPTGVTLATITGGSAGVAFYEKSGTATTFSTAFSVTTAGSVTGGTVASGHASASVAGDSSMVVTFAAASSLSADQRAGTWACGITAGSVSSATAVAGYSAEVVPNTAICGASAIVGSFLVLAIAVFSSLMM